jgi:molybdate transport system substrate-binding protein
LRRPLEYAYLKEGQSGVYLARLLEELSIARLIEAKVVRPDRDIVSQLVAQGDVEVGIVVVTQILTTPGVTLAGPLPDDIQHDVVFSGGVSARSRAAGVARELLLFLTGPSARAVMRSQGMQPAPDVTPLPQQRHEIAARSHLRSGLLRHARR